MPSMQMYFNAKDELITIVPNFSLPTENATATCIGVRCQAVLSLADVGHGACAKHAAVPARKPQLSLPPL